jgi:hypothetical protein
MNFSRPTKRILIIIVISIMIIFISKSLLGRAVKNLGIETQKKQHSKNAQQVSVFPASATAIAGTNVESAPTIAEGMSEPR